MSALVDLFPGLDLASALVAWVAATWAVLTLWDWCTPPKETK